MRRRLATLFAIVLAVLALAAPSSGDGGWGACNDSLVCCPEDPEC